jgi:sec-independent protein translocase protein TatC
MLSAGGSAMADEPRVMTFGDHLDELRSRLLWAGVGVVLMFVVGLIFGSSILAILTHPLIHALKATGQAPTLLATSPLEGFGAYVKVATVAAFVVAMPWALYQLWLFVSPGLYEKERRFVYFLLPLSAALTAAGALFLYYVILPISLFFLISFGAGLLTESPAPAPLPPGMSLPVTPILSQEPASPAPGEWWVNSTLAQLRVRVDAERTMGVPLVGAGLIAQQYRVSEYVNLVLVLGIAFSVAFQLPLALLLLGWVGLVTPGDLTRYRKYVLFGCVVGSALMPTQDPWSLLALSGVLYGLFELGIVFMRLIPPRRVAEGLLTRSGRDGDREA